MTTKPIFATPLAEGEDEPTMTKGTYSTVTKKKPLKPVIEKSSTLTKGKSATLIRAKPSTTIKDKSSTVDKENSSTVTEPKTAKRKADDMDVDPAESNGNNTQTDKESEDPKAAADAPFFPAGKRQKLEHHETRKITIPNHRHTPLKANWEKIYSPIVEHLKLNVRFNLKTRKVEIKTGKHTEDASNIQKAADFVQAFVYGFDVEDALALIRLHDLYLETFDVKDVKLSLAGDHMGRAVGRIAGKGGKTRFTLENATRTRIIIADSRIHILGAFHNIQVVRRAICSLILGSPPSKVFGNLKAYADKAQERA